MYPPPPPEVVKKNPQTAVYMILGKQIEMILNVCGIYSLAQLTMFQILYSHTVLDGLLYLIVIAVCKLCQVVSRPTVFNRLIDITQES